MPLGIDVMEDPLFKLGEEQGKESTRKETAIKMLKMSEFSIELIARLTDLSVEEVRDLKRELCD